METLNMSVKQQEVFSALLNPKQKVMTLTIEENNLHHQRFPLIAGLQLLQKETYQEMLITTPIVNSYYLPYNALENWKKERTKEVSALAKNQIHSIQFEHVSALWMNPRKQRFILIENAQVLTPHEVKLILIRAMEPCKYVFVGSPESVKNPDLEQTKNGFAFLIEKCKEEEMFAHFDLTE